MSAAIGRQQQLGLMIGEELNYQVELLAETEDIVDRTEGRLNKAKRNLTKVSKKAKEKGKFNYFIYTNLYFFLMNFNLIY